MRLPLPPCPYELNVLGEPYTMRTDQFNREYPGFLKLGFYTIQGKANDIPFVIEARYYNYHLYTNFNTNNPFSIQFSETYSSSEVQDRRWDSDEVVRYYGCKLLNQLKTYLKVDSLTVNLISLDTNDNDVC